MAQITLRDYLQETEDAISHNRIEEAFAHCQSVLAHFPESLEAQRLLGEVYLAQGHLEEAQQTFDWVLTNDPENVVTYCNRALICEHLADYDTALDCYQQAYELSRSSEIRECFNKLNEQTGQQGFMFSRAGLARLYMRGDLLTQAIQEWEAVLAANPDRLDARTGLLEAYWREGLFDRVEQLAHQILQDVSGCVKALLLLAYVVSARDMLQAQDLIKRVEGLDPDLMMAQELFADMLASQAQEPFLRLLHKPGVSLEVGAAAVPVHALAKPQEDLPMWAGQSDGQRWQEPASAFWAGEDGRDVHDRPVTQGESLLNSWQPQQVSPTHAGFSATQELREGASPSGVWQSLGELAGSAFNESDVRKSSAPVPILEAPQAIQPPVQPIPAVAARQPIPPVPSVPSVVEVTQVLQPLVQPMPPQTSRTTVLPMPSVPQVVEAKAATPSPVKNEPPLTPEPIASPFAVESDDEEESFFGPAWLKSIGASSMAPEMSQELLAPPPVAELPVTHATLPVQQSGILESWVLQTQDVTSSPQIAGAEQSAQAEEPEWMKQIAPTPQPAQVEEPEWMKRMTASAQPAQAEEPNWLKEVASAASLGESAAVPEWMRQIAPTSQPAQMEEPEWMRQIAPTSQPAQMEEPEWMRQIAPTSQPAQMEEPEWMRQIAPTSQPAQMEEPEWMRQIAPTSQPAQMEEPEWMRQIAPTSQQVQAQESDWLQGLANAASPSAAAAVPEWMQQMAPTSQPVQMERPEWLKDVAGAPHFSSTPDATWSQPAKETATPASQEEPSWLQEIGGTMHSARGANLDRSEPALPAAEVPSAMWGNEQGQQSPAGVAGQNEQNVLTTLEALQSTLFSQGFVPLEPNTLSAFAQTQSPAQPGVPQHTVLETQGEEASLSSAFAQLGNFNQPPVAPVPQPKPTVPEIPTLPAQPDPVVPVEPWWASALRADAGPMTPAASSAMSPVTGGLPDPVVPPVKRDFASKTPEPAQMNEPLEVTVRVSPVVAPAKYVSAMPAPQRDALLDDELETTMRRPAVRLQPTQPGSAREQSPAAAKQQHVERAATSPAKAPDNGSMNYQHRLVKSYQHQLVGDYDEAMQEYRIIIRNAPELLNEVISNVRALLKLAPKYSAGYRVLGDAYMRQGEYLQAMEAYNKALTMAKRAKV